MIDDGISSEVRYAIESIRRSLSDAVDDAVTTDAVADLHIGVRMDVIDATEEATIVSTGNACRMASWYHQRGG